MVDTRARIHERGPRPPLGVAQWPLPRTMRFSRWPRLPLVLQRRCDLDAPQRATRFSPTRRTWETRRPKELRQCKPRYPCGRVGPYEACASRSFPRWLSRAPPVAGDVCPRPRVNGFPRTDMGWRPIRVLVHDCIVGLGLRSDCVPRRSASFRKPRCFSPPGTA